MRTAARSSLCSPNTTLTPSADGGLLSVVAGPETGTPNTQPWSSAARGHDGSVCTTFVANRRTAPVTGVNTRGLDRVVNRRRAWGGSRGDAGRGRRRGGAAAVARRARQPEWTLPEAAHHRLTCS
jgi:hypothetical protein